MSTRHLEKVREEIKRRLSEILEFEARDPRLELITVMDVRVSKDLRHATIYVSAAASDVPEEEAIDVLKAHRGFFRSGLAKRLDLRHTPELRFEIDPVEKHARRVEELLDESADRS